MKSIPLAVSVLSIALMSFAVVGCQTDSPGVTYVAGTYRAMLAASPERATDAARRVVEDMKLSNINSSGTKIDGKVTARNAQNEAIVIDLEQAGEGVSKVSVQVGSGDEAVSMQIIEKIKAKLSWFGASKSPSPAMKNMAGTYSAMVNVTPDKATAAARKAVENMKLVDIRSTSTGIDGMVRAKTAQNDDVDIDIEQSGDGVSKVSIRVGTLGDQAISKQILDRINDILH